tara:strand:+ start:3199 stop:3585 length:387 start_codon:yes stop_codon:yes gene_type:complete
MLTLLSRRKDMKRKVATYVNDVECMFPTESAESPVWLLSLFDNRSERSIDDSQMSNPMDWNDFSLLAQDAADLFLLVEKHFNGYTIDVTVEQFVFDYVSVYKTQYKANRLLQWRDKSFARQQKKEKAV